MPRDTSAEWINAVSKMTSLAVAHIVGLKPDMREVAASRRMFRLTAVMRLSLR